MNTTTTTTAAGVWVLTIMDGGYVVFESAHETERDARRMARAIVGESVSVTYKVEVR